MVNHFTCIHILIALVLSVLCEVSVVFAQPTKLEELEKCLAESLPSSEERFRLTMEVSQMFAGFSSIPLEDYDKLDTIIGYAEEALNWTAKNGSPIHHSQLQQFLTDCYLYAGQSTKFLQLAGEMIVTNSFASAEDKLQLYRKLAPIYLDIGYVEKFIELTDELARVRKDLDEPDAFVVNEQSHIAQAYTRLQDYKRARHHYRRALRVLEGGSNLLAVASISNNIGQTFAREEKRDSAATFFNRALSILSAGGSPAEGFGTAVYTQHLINRIEANLALLDLARGEYDLIIPRVEKVLESGRKLLEHKTVIEALHTLGLLHYYKKSYDRSLQFLDQAERLIKPQTENTLQLENWDIRYRVLLASGQQEVGDKVHRKMTSLQDSITYVARDNIAIVASIAYETDKKEKALREQGNLLAEQQSEIARSKQQQLTYIMGIAAMGFLLITAYFFLKKVLRQKKKIEQQKQRLDKSLREKDTLMKEIHHRVKNNLQVVSSILARQGQSADDERIKKFMEEGQNRIQSMAMIHQQLYQTQDFEQVNLAHYTRLLLLNISSYYRLEEQKIEVDIRVDDLSLDVNVAIPYGLILNELVSNCYKYGFAGKRNGELLVEVSKLTGNLFQLKVSDDGNGLPDDMEQRAKKSLGINLVKGIAWQLRGKLDYRSTPPGSTFTVTFVNDLKQLE